MKASTLDSNSFVLTKVNTVFVTKTNQCMWWWWWRCCWCTLSMLQTRCYWSEWVCWSSDQALFTPSTVCLSLVTQLSAAVLCSCWWNGWLTLTVSAQSPQTHWWNPDPQVLNQYGRQSGSNWHCTTVFWLLSQLILFNLALPTVTWFTVNRFNQWATSQCSWWNIDARVSYLF